jgi:hypothetical protein
MTRDEAVALILDRCGNRSSDTTLAAKTVTEMKFVQEELERGEKANLPWFLETEYTNAAFKTSASVDTVAVPTGFLRELDEERVTLFYQDTTQDDEWVPIAKVDYDEGKTEFGGEGAGAPQAYCLLGENYKFFPAPDAEYALKALIYVGDTTLATNVENKWLKYAGKLIIGRTGEVVAGQLLRDEAARTLFADMAMRGGMALERDNVARKEAGRARSQGED